MPRKGREKKGERSPSPEKTEGKIRFLGKYFGYRDRWCGGKRESPPALREKNVSGGQ